MTQVNSVRDSVSSIEESRNNLLSMLNLIENSDTYVDKSKTGYDLATEYYVWEPVFISYFVEIDGKVTWKHKSFLNQIEDHKNSTEQIKHSVIKTIDTYPNFLKIVPDFFTTVIDYEIATQSSAIYSLIAYIWNLGSIIGNLEGEKSAKFNNVLLSYVNLLNNELNEAGLTSFGDKVFSEDLEDMDSALTQEKDENPLVNLEILLERLSKLIGLQKVKEDVFSLINLVRIREMRIRTNLPVPAMSLHLVFTGNPGTGKTTVARLLAEIYAHIGLLSTGQLVEVDRSQLVAGYIGQTAIKVLEVVEKATGGILFIDEAYSLTSNQHGSDYGSEAVDTLIKLMEDRRNDLIVIVAGYSEKMNDFINSNPGIKSRFNKHIHFDDYSSSEMLEIFQSMCSESAYTLSPSAVEYLNEYFIKLQRNADFGNAREVRNLFEKTIGNQANRLMSLLNPDEINLTNIEYSDVAGSTGK